MLATMIATGIEKTSYFLSLNKCWAIFSTNLASYCTFVATSVLGTSTLVKMLITTTAAAVVAARNRTRLQRSKLKLLTLVFVRLTYKNCNSWLHGVYIATRMPQPIKTIVSMKIICIALPFFVSKKPPRLIGFGESIVALKIA